MLLQPTLDIIDGYSARKADWLVRACAVIHGNPVGIDTPRRQRGTDVVLTVVTTDYHEFAGPRGSHTNLRCVLHPRAPTHNPRASDEGE